jgi:hypothetical protein
MVITQNPPRARVQPKVRVFLYICIQVFEMTIGLQPHQQRTAKPRQPKKQLFKAPILILHAKSRHLFLSTVPKLCDFLVNPGTDASLSPQLFKAPILILRAKSGHLFLSTVPKLCDFLVNPGTRASLSLMHLGWINSGPSFRMFGRSISACAKLHILFHSLRSSRQTLSEV